MLSSFFIQHRLQIYHFIELTYQHEHDFKVPHLIDQYMCHKLDKK